MNKLQKISLIILLLVIFLFAVANIIRFKFFKGDVDENGVYHRYYSTLKMNIYTDKSDGHKEYKINNNTYVFLKNLKKGDIIGMPNIYGCAQFSILQNDKAIVFHHSSSVKSREVRSVIRKYIKHFNNKDDVYVSILFSANDKSEQKRIENVIKSEVKRNLGKDVIISKALYEKIKNDKSLMYQYRATITDKGFVNEIVEKRNFFTLRRKNEKYIGSINFKNKIRIHELYNDYFLIAYADNKIVMLRSEMDKPIPVDIFDSFGNNEPQIQLILPKKNEQNNRIINQLLHQITLKKKFSNYDLKIFYYKNVPYNYYYSGKITKKGLAGRVEKYGRNALYRN